ncbi:molybdopterin-binding oxidoreductase [Limnochorda pilosa]|uniref:Molybdopterin-binding oxidoreductase n=2 Tax=Limnochorda pilosa TaxID=1555112 RepID=A0A0K2SN99_LIMPI|nr:molybdopterin-binding oxidoreductase [Limnochorda pilosa]
MAGVLAAFLAAALQAALRFTLGTPLAPEEVAQHLFRWVPLEVFRFFVQRLGELAKWGAFGGSVAFYLMAGALAAPWVRRAGDRTAVLWILAGAAAHVGFLSGLAPWTHAAGVYLLSSALYVCAARTLLPGPPRPVQAGAARGNDADSQDPLVVDAGRRRLLAVAVVAAVGAVTCPLARAVRAVAQAARQGAGEITARIDGLRGAVPWITPNRDFYRVSKNLFDPRVSARDWRLRIDGNVERPLELRHEDLAGLEAQVEPFTTLSCISNPIGGDLIGNARWGGVPLRSLLERARLRPGVVDLRFEAADGYTDSIPLEKALHPETLLAWEMNGERLPPDHGFPARLIVPGIYGMKNVKWITRIEAVNEDYKGYWEVRGWSDTAVTRTLSRIDVPRNGQTVGPGPVYAAGIAFAGDRGISRVEVSFDGGATWREAELEPVPTGLTWVRWLIEWQPAEPGRYTLAVRAYDGRGERQEETSSNPLPEGATGLHRIQVTWRA